MKMFLLFCASLMFNVGAATVKAHPAQAAAAMTAAVRSLDGPCCCPEWLCRLICPIVCGTECQPCPSPANGCCSPGSGCCNR
jgi:hypothetical protein